jgi:hypothetical protein
MLSILHRRGLALALALSAGILPVMSAHAAEADKQVQKLLDKSKLQYEVDENGDYKVTYDLGTGRTQLVYVRSVVLKYGQLSVREVLSLGYRSDVEAFPAAAANRLLEMSNRAKVGGFAKQGQYALFSTKIAAKADAKELAAALEATARMADEAERELMAGKDEF